MRDIWCAPYFAVRNFSLSFSQTGLILKLTLLFGVPGVVLFFSAPWCTDWVFSGSSILIWNSKLQTKLFFAKLQFELKKPFRSLHLRPCPALGTAGHDSAYLIKTHKPGLKWQNMTCLFWLDLVLSRNINTILSIAPWNLTNDKLFSQIPRAVVRPADC